VRSGGTYRQVSQATEIPSTPSAVLEAMGFARAAPDEPMREDELAVIPLRFVELGKLPLKGFAHPVRVLEAHRA
jgi:hypothetical protein